MKIHKSFIMLVAAAMAATFTACSDDDIKQDYNPIIDNPQTEEPTPGEPGEGETSSRNEKYRPQIHFTPAKNWMNDPNGMIYLDGTPDKSAHPKNNIYQDNVLTLAKNSLEYLKTR